MPRYERPPKPPVLTRSKVGRRLRDACERINAAQTDQRMRGQQMRVLHAVWEAIELQEAIALDAIELISSRRTAYGSQPSKEKLK